MNSTRKEIEKAAHVNRAKRRLRDNELDCIAKR